MKTSPPKTPKTPTAKHWALFRKLTALAERGVNGEKTAAAAKLARLTSRLDFTQPEPGMDLFKGNFQRSIYATWVYSFAPGEAHIANSVKWAIQSATGMRCLYRMDGALMAEATPGTARDLGKIAETISRSFGDLAGKVGTNERPVFIMGLYDGMMREERAEGQQLPAVIVPKTKGKQPPPARTLNVHPYTLGASLGKQIRFSVPLATVAAELDKALAGQLTE